LKFGIGGFGAAETHLRGYWNWTYARG